MKSVVPLKKHNGARLRVRSGTSLETGDRFGMGNGCVVGAGTVLKGSWLSNSLILQKREEQVIQERL